MEFSYVVKSVSYGPVNMVVTVMLLRQSQPLLCQVLFYMYLIARQKFQKYRISLLLI
jgi:hypothetical protein